jgi:hypothetical protein
MGFASQMEAAYKNNYGNQTPYQLENPDVNKAFIEEMKAIYSEMEAVGGLDVNIGWALEWLEDEMNNELPINSSGSLFTSLIDKDNLAYHLMSEDEQNEFLDY